MLLRIMPAAPLLPKSPLISSHQVVDASFQSRLVDLCIHSHLVYNAISAYMIVWWLLSFVCDATELGLFTINFSC